MSGMAAYARPARGSLVLLSSAIIYPVPRVTAKTLGACRIFLCLSILYFLLQYDPSDFGSLFRSGPGVAVTKVLGGPPFLSALSGSTSFCLAFYCVLVAFTLAAAAGLWTRTSMILLTLSLWLAALLWNYGHFLTPLLLGMTATMFAPWGAGLSIDAVLARRQNTERSPLYGYPIWLLGLAIGLAYASAGISKLLITQGAWIWNTGSRNGFIQDFGIAFTDLGLLFASSYPLALMASVLSAFGQIAYVFSSFTRNNLIKYGICYLIALPFLVGLVIFMGHFWWPWAILIAILYLPWETIDRRIWGDRQAMAGLARYDFQSDQRRQQQRSIFLAATSALIGIHLLAVAINREFEPLFSNYPMYIARKGVGPNTPEEARLWQKRVAHGHHFRPVVHLVLADGSQRDISLAYRIGEFISSRQIYRSVYPGLHARMVYHRAHRNMPISADSCAAIRNAAHSISDGRARFVRYNAQFYEVADGAMTLRPVEPNNSVTYNLATCTHSVGVSANRATAAVLH
jgi:hypothetical protein